jgi:hypothetical protein
MGHNTIASSLGRRAVHPFPARMAAPVALLAIDSLSKPSRVLDPMMGSGTVLACARARGHEALGVDLDPLAVLIARVWTESLDCVAVAYTGKRTLARARAGGVASRVLGSYPDAADDETRAFMRYWFDVRARRQLTWLASAIRGISDDAIRRALWCAFSRLIIAKQSGASRALDLAHSRPHRAYERAPIEPLERFLGAVDQVLAGAVDRRTRSRGPQPRISQGDARSLAVDDASVDLVLTSPPYLNAIDYMRCSKFSLVWMGYTISQIRQLRRAAVGAEVGSSSPPWVSSLLAACGIADELPPRLRAILARYVMDMHLALSEASRVLAPRGRAVYVLGESTLRGVFVPTARIVSEIAKSVGLCLSSSDVRSLPENHRYLPPPSHGKGMMNRRLRTEVVLTFHHV